MQKSYLAMLSLAAGVVLTAGAAAPASAMQPGKPSAAFHGGTVNTVVVPVRDYRESHSHDGHHAHESHHDGGEFREHHERRHFRGPRFYVAPVYSYGAYNDGCHWLKRKALNTGSRYWWHRYNECRWG